MKYPGVALTGAVISTVLCTIQIVVAIGLAFLESHAGHVGSGELLAIALIGGVGVVGVAAGVGAMRGKRAPLLISAALQLAWAALIGGGLLVARSTHLSVADRELLIVFTIPAGAAAIAGALCLVGGRR